MIISSPLMLGGQSFVTKTVNKVSTVVRNNIIALTQEEKNEAGDFYNADTGEIEYAEVSDNNFGPNWLLKKGASAVWMAGALTNPLLKETIRRATGNNIVNKAPESEALNEARDQSSNSFAGPPINPLEFASFGSGTMRYPLNHRQEIDYDYLKVDCIKYLADFNLTDDKGKANQSKTAFKENSLALRTADQRMGGQKILGSVFLPMQPGIA